LRLLKSLDRFLKTDAGNVKQLEGFDPSLFRLRVGDWRLIYRKQGDDAIEVVRVRNRREAYR
jgi:mRNA-degrading endonuclease RelE of RelBE toxin-antitoxin system